MRRCRAWLQLQALVPYRFEELQGPRLLLRVAWLWLLMTVIIVPATPDTLERQCRQSSKAALRDTGTYT